MDWAVRRLLFTSLTEIGVNGVKVLPTNRERKKNEKCKKTEQKQFQLKNKLKKMLVKIKLKKQTEGKKMIVSCKN